MEEFGSVVLTSASESDLKTLRKCKGEMKAQPFKP